MVKIYTFSHKRPDFIEIQLNSFKKYLDHEFEFVVFNNAGFDKNKTNYNAIWYICKKHNIKCIDIKLDNELIEHIINKHDEIPFNNNIQYTNSGIACAYPLCWAWKHIISPTNDKICIIDSDMFFVAKESIEQLLNQYDIVYKRQEVEGQRGYMWNGISFINLNTIPNKENLDWWCGKVENIPVDVGGQTFHYLNKYPDLKYFQLKTTYIADDPSCDFHPSNYEYFGINNIETILHYRGGSNWDMKPTNYHINKTQWLKNKLGIENNLQVPSNGYYREYYE